MFYFWIPFAQNVDYGKYRKRIFRLKKKKRKWCHFYYFYLLFLPSIISQNYRSNKLFTAFTTLKLQSRVVDNRFSIRIRNSVPIESARIAFKHRPWNNLFPTSHAHWIRDSTRRFNSKKKKKKKKNVTRAKKTRGCNDYPHQECIPVYVYIQNAPYDGIRCPFVSIRCWTKRNDGGFTLLRATQR